MNLQHLALIRLIETGKCPVDNPVVDDLVFEIGTIKKQLDEKIEVQESIINNSLIDPCVDMDDYFDITCDIQDTLFVAFNYKDVIKTEEHIQWKEYFNCLYEHCVIDYDSEQMLWFTYKCFDMFEPPVELEFTDPCYIVVKTIKDLFGKLKEEHHNILSQLMPPSEYREYRLERGRIHLEMVQKRDELVRQRDAYETAIKMYDSIKCQLGSSQLSG